jgi:hypothetical protein
MGLALAAGSTPHATAEVDEGLARTVFEDKRFSWTSQGAGNVWLHCKRDSFAERHRAALLRSAEGARSRALEYLDEPRYDRRLDVFYVDSREEMEQLVGGSVTGLADWRSGAAFLVCTPDWRSFDQHEITHVISIDLWGYPKDPSAWLVEGLAIRVDGWCREYSVDDLAHHLATGGALPSIQDLGAQYASLGEVRAGVAAASLIEFIRSEFGVGALRTLWGEGLGKVEDVLGLSAAELESRWKKHILEQTGAVIDVDWQTLEDPGCG